MAEDKIGWVYANVDKGWTQFDGEKVYILYDAGLNVREVAYDIESAIVGYVKAEESYPVLNQLYSYLRINVPGGKQGWIYAGKPNDPWVSFNDELALNTIISDGNHNSKNDLKKLTTQDNVILKTESILKEVKSEPAVFSVNQKEIESSLAYSGS